MDTPDNYPALRRLAVARAFLRAFTEEAARGPDLSDFGPPALWDEDDRISAASRRAEHFRAADRRIHAAQEEVRIAEGLVESSAHAEPGRVFFASAVKGRLTVLLAGPFTRHEDALRALPRARAYATRHYSGTDFGAAFGTCSVVGPGPHPVIEAVHAYATGEHDDIERRPAMPDADESA